MRYRLLGRSLLTFMPIALAVAFEALVPSIVGPSRWFPFYPAVFLSSWLGGRRLAVMGTFVTTGLVWWLFIPPAHTLSKNPHEVLPAVVFCVMGVFFAVFHHRLSRQCEHEEAR